MGIWHIRPQLGLIIYTALATKSREESQKVAVLFRAFSWPFVGNNIRFVMCEVK
jgi:hypothetical protein